MSFPSRLLLAGCVLGAVVTSAGTALTLSERPLAVGVPDIAAPVRPAPSVPLTGDTTPSTSARPDSGADIEAPSPPAPPPAENGTVVPPVLPTPSTEAGIAATGDARPGVAEAADPLVELPPAAAESPSMPPPTSISASDQQRLEEGLRIACASGRIQGRICP